VQIIVSSWRLGITGVELATGRPLWQKAVFGQKQERAIASPLVAGDLVLANCGFAGRDKHVVALRPGATAGSMEEAWRVEKSVPHIPSPIVIGDRAFLWNDLGVITCVKLATGETVWIGRVPGEFFASPVSDGGRIFGVDKTGVVTVIGVGDQLEVLARHELGEATQATPAIANGCLYLRTLTHLQCVGVRK